MQLIVSLAALVGGAQLFIHEVSRLSELFGISPLVLSLIIAPLATELPEKFNSVLWVRQRKDNLAMRNISGAMVFQSCIPVTVGLWFTPWVLTEAAIASAVIAIAAGLLLQVFLRTGNVLTGRELPDLVLAGVALADQLRDLVHGFQYGAVASVSIKGQCPVAH